MRTSAHGRLKAHLGCIAAGVSCVSFAVHADNDPRGDRSLETVVVTAQKRAELLVEVPQSVSVLTADSLAKMGATEFRDFAGTVPGMTFMTAGAGYTTITLRGVTTGNDVSPTVGIYIDEVPYGSSTNYAIGAQLALDVGLFDLERLEVLRGPQGTLYGASTMGGLVKYVTKKPDTGSFEGGMQAGLSDTQHGGTNYNVSGVVNLPISTDKAAVRISGFQSHDGGYIDNVALGKENVNAADIYGGRVDVLLTPTDALSVRLVAFAQNIDREGEAVSDHTVDGTAIYGGLNQYRVLPESFEQRFRMASGTVTYDMDWASITSISSYQSSDTQMLWDRSATLVSAFASIGAFSGIRQTFDLPLDRFTQEVRFSSSGEHTLDWVIGGFYTRESSENIGSYIPYGLTGQPVPINLVHLRIPSRYEEYAAFGDVTWHITDKFDVTAGLRYAPNEMTFSQQGTGLLGRSAPVTKSDDEVVTYLGNARYRFNDHTTAYLRYATGYRPGGPNVVTFNPTTGAPIGVPEYDPDRLKSYELGFKAEAASGLFSVDTAVYYIDWSKFQLAISQGGFGAYANASGGARIRGAEVAVTSRPVDGLLTSVALAYQDAELQDNEPALGAVAGAKLPNVPRRTASINADYELPFGNLQPTIGASVRYADERTNRLSGAIYTLPDYTAVDVRGGLTLQQVELRVYVRNLTDERGELSAATFRNPPSPSIMQPRTFGISATTRF